LWRPGAFYLLTDFSNTPSIDPSFFSALPVVLLGLPLVMPVDVNSSPFLCGLTLRWNALAKSRRQSNLVVLFVDQDLANLFAHGVLGQILALADALAIITNCFRFVSRSNCNMSVAFSDVRTVLASTAGIRQDNQSAWR